MGIAESGVGSDRVRLVADSLVKLRLWSWVGDMGMICL